VTGYNAKSCKDFNSKYDGLALALYASDFDVTLKDYAQVYSRVSTFSFVYKELSIGLSVHK
jgi:hypothetical protein